MPVVRRSQGAGKAPAPAPARPRRAGGVDSGLRDGLRPRTRDGLVWGEGGGWRPGFCHRLEIKTEPTRDSPQWHCVRSPSSWCTPQSCPSLPRGACVLRRPGVVCFPSPPRPRLPERAPVSDSPGTSGTVRGALSSCLQLHRCFSREVLLADFASTLPKPQLNPFFILCFVFFN